MTAEKIIDLFLENAGRSAAGIRQVANAEELRRALADLVAAGAAVYCPALSNLEQAVAGVFPGRVGDYADAEVSIEEVFAGIAETGSIVCASVEGRAVQSSLLPARQVAILPAGKIFATLDDFFAGQPVPPTNLTLITGPSRTADIELTLAIGVHGPQQLNILVVTDSEKGDREIGR